MNTSHLTDGLLVRAMDGELEPHEVQEVSAHLASCESCGRQYAMWRALSGRVEDSVRSAAVEGGLEDRARLSENIAAHLRTTPKIRPERVMWRFGWGMAIAATLALAIILTPRERAVIEQQGPPIATAQASTIEVDGETFIALPYSNPDLPTSAPRIVQMQVPVSSLVDLGITLEPVSSQVPAQDRSVLADVLLGADGQPIGVHILSAE